MNKVCKICGKEYTGRNGNIKTCSIECSRVLLALHSHTYWKVYSPDGLYHGVCPACGKAFANQRARKYCSDECQKEAELKKAKQRRREKKFCKNCGKQIPAERMRKHFCSDKCFDEAHSKSRRIEFTDEYITRRITEKYPHVEYAGGYKGSENPLNIRCKECGYVFQTMGQALRKNYKLRCPNCKEREQKKETQKLKQAALIRRLLCLLNNRGKFLIEVDWRTRTCAVCGKRFIMATKNRTFCSDKCKSVYKANYRRAGKKRRRAATKNTKNKKQGARCLTWQSIYHEERGICGICGGACNKNDYKITGGIFFAGDTYPSLDHIVALANGGLHIRTNVQLAHFKCNREKGAN